MRITGLLPHARSAVVPKSSIHHARDWLRTLVVATAVLSAFVTTPAQARLQCVPYAREVSGIAIHGNAATWWDQADGRYARGPDPREGAVLAFRPTGAMPLGHVAVVDTVIDDRRILLNHANWSGPGLIEEGALAIDVSPAGDWSEVRVWFAPSQSLGSRENPTFGFIYPVSESPTQFATTEQSAEFAEAFAAWAPAGR